MDMAAIKGSVQNNFMVFLCDNNLKVESRVFGEAMQTWNNHIPQNTCMAAAICMALDKRSLHHGFFTDDGE